MTNFIIHRSTNIYNNMDFANYNQLADCGISLICLKDFKVHTPIKSSKISKIKPLCTHRSHWLPASQCGEAGAPTNVFHVCTLRFHVCGSRISQTSGPSTQTRSVNATSKHGSWHWHRQAQTSNSKRLRKSRHPNWLTFVELSVSRWRSETLPGLTPVPSTVGVFCFSLHLSLFPLSPPSFRHLVILSRFISVHTRPILTFRPLSYLNLFFIFLFFSYKWISSIACCMILSSLPLPPFFCPSLPFSLSSVQHPGLKILRSDSSSSISSRIGWILLSLSHAFTLSLLPVFSPPFPTFFLSIFPGLFQSSSLCHLLLLLCLADCDHLTNVMSPHSAAPPPLVTSLRCH